MKLQEKVAVITGGGRGIGFAIAEEFHREGARLALLDRNEKTLLQAEIALKQQTICMHGDVTSLDDLEKLYQTTFKNFGKINILVANAGIYQFTPLQDVTEKAYTELMDINLKGVFFTVQRALPFLSDGASIILIASTAGHRGEKDVSVYNASKAAVISLAQSFAADLVDKKIRVNSISPGMTRTHLLMNIASPKEIAAWEQEIPLKNSAHPKQIAKAALFLASDDSDYMTGSDLLVDGGCLNLSL